MQLIKPKLLKTATLRFPDSVWTGKTDADLFKKKVLRIFEKKPELHDEAIFLCMHNHRQNGNVMSQPIVQYRLENDYGLVWAMADGCETIAKYLYEFYPHFNNDEAPFRFKELGFFWHEESISPIGYTTEPVVYQLHKWIALSRHQDGTDYKEIYDQKATVAQKRELLEDILRGEILGVLKNIGYETNEYLEVEILGRFEFSKIYIAEYKDFKASTEKQNLTFRAFEVRFQTNFLLPRHIGLGKYASIGFGQCEIV